MNQRMSEILLARLLPMYSHIFSISQRMLVSVVVAIIVLLAPPSRADYNRVVLSLSDLHLDPDFGVAEGEFDYGPTKTRARPHLCLFRSMR